MDRPDGEMKDSIDALGYRPERRHAFTKGLLAEAEEEILLSIVEEAGRGLGEGDGAAMHVSMTLTLVDTQTGKPIWIGSGTQRASFTLKRALGLNEGPTDLGVGRDVIISLIKDMDKEIRQHREEELARIKAEESAKLKAAAEAEKRRLEEIIKQEPEEGN